MKSLSPKQARFVEEYLLDLNATQAAIRAGYSKKTAAVQGHLLLNKTLVRDAIEEAKQKRSDAIQVDAEYVLRRLYEIDQMDVIDILFDDGSVRPLSQWPKIWRSFITDISVTELAASSEPGANGLLKKIKWPDKLRNLELLGKHVGVQAFRDKVEHSGSISHEEALALLE